MAGDTVTTIFGGDDSNFQAAARKVKESVSALAGFSSPMKFFKSAQQGAEGLEKATSAAKAGVQSLESAFAPLLAMGAALVGVATVFDGIKRSIELAAKVETAEFHLGAVAGGADKARASIQRLHEIGDQTATGFGTLAEGAVRLEEAGQSADSAAESMGKLNKIALNSGSDLNELGEIYARVLTKSDVSSKDLVKLAMTGIPGIKAISEEFKNVERNTASANLEIDKTIQGLNRVYEQTEKQASSANSFGGKIGLMQASFANWAKTGGSAIGGLVQAIDGISEGGIGKMSGTFGKEFTEGLKQIETETGLSGAALQQFMAEGKVGYEDLISASARFREEEHKAADANLEAQKLANQNDLLEKQRGLLGQVRDAIERATSKGGIFASVDAFFQTFNGKWQEVQHSIDGMFKNFGVPLIDALKPALDGVTTFFQGPAKAAAVAWGDELGGTITAALKGLKTGDWSDLQAKGVKAFAAILKYMSIGMQEIGVVLGSTLGGPGMIKVIDGLRKMLVAAGHAFGKAIAEGISPMNKIQDALTKYLPGASQGAKAVSDIRQSMFTPEQKAEFAERMKGHEDDTDPGAKYRIVEDIASGDNESGNKGDLKDLSQGGTQMGEGLHDIMERVRGAQAGIKGFSLTGEGEDGKPAGMDQTTWDTFYKPLTARPGEPASAATTTVSTPLATAAATIPAAQGGIGGPAAAPAPYNPVASSNPILGPGGIPTGGVFETLKPTPNQQAASGGTFSGFQAPSAQPERKETERAPGRTSSSQEKSVSQGPMTVDQEVMQKHWQTMHDMGISPIGNSINPLDEKPKAIARRARTWGISHCLSGNHSG